MKKILAVFLVLIMAMVSPVFAKGKKPPPGEVGRIVEISAVSITLSVGKSGDDHITYKITDQTEVKLNGATATADNLRAGMVGRVVTVENVPGTAKSIDAHDPAKH